MTSQQIDLPVLPTLEQFLATVGLGQYNALFEQHDIEMAQLVSLNEQDLENLGMASFGHRRLLQDSIQQLIADLNRQLTEKSQKESRHLTISVLKGYGVLAIAVAIFLQAADYPNSLTGTWFIDGLLGAAALLGYLAPTVISWWRGHPYKWVILVANTFFGFTGFVWVICLVFSFGVINPGSAAALAILSTLLKKR